MCFCNAAILPEPEHNVRNHSRKEKHAEAATKTALTKNSEGL
ncbi:hypothetical protein SCH4B_1361 [Ruegeria sp. TrichCH4B]|nr:hypothetical protein SCH4B_1361 [Ruegeria sp. TrichCH4B]